VLPLEGVRVLDFSTLLPGPFASLMLAEAGATVIKIERPGGEDMRRFAPCVGDTSHPFLALNGGKRLLALDLKAADAHARLRPLLTNCDVVIEQFRPGVMERLGLGYGEVSAINPGVVYCSISGYGQTGPLAAAAGHDLNYQALSGLLGEHLPQGAPPSQPLPLIADIAGGAYPAVINVLLALLQRARTGRGRHLDIAMAAGVLPFAWLALAAQEHPDQPGRALLSGGSPRYRLYATRDGWFVAVAALEDKFWRTLCQVLGVPESVGADEIAACIGAQDAASWRDVLERADCCCTVVRTLEEAAREEPFAGWLAARPGVRHDEAAGLAAPVPIAEGLRKPSDQPRLIVGEE
jgi:crotonobetainyl-CoA:carnitine CoA-transferase CaiB-like acyl-CoA transferase